MDKNSHLGSEFALTFSTIDNPTQELVRIAPGGHSEAVVWEASGVPVSHPQNEEL